VIAGVRHLGMMRQCSQYGMSTEPWAILGRHPLAPEVPQHSVTPCLVGGERNMAWVGGETAVQSADWPDLCAPLRQSPTGVVKTTRVLAIVPPCDFSVKNER
jgi:hypothetical protein